MDDKRQNNLTESLLLESILFNKISYVREKCLDCIPTRNQDKFQFYFFEKGNQQNKISEEDLKKWINNTPEYIGDYRDRDEKGIFIIKHGMYSTLHSFFDPRYNNFPNRWIGFLFDSKSERIIAYSIGGRMSKKHQFGTIDRVDVSPDSRRQGLCYILMDHVWKHIKEMITRKENPATCLNTIKLTNYADIAGEKCYIKTAQQNGFDYKCVDDPKLNLKNCIEYIFTLIPEG